MFVVIVVAVVVVTIVVGIVGIVVIVCYCSAFHIGQLVQFHVFADGSGLGAEEIVV